MDVQYKSMENVMDDYIFKYTLHLGTGLSV